MVPLGVPAERLEEVPPPPPAGALDLRVLVDGRGCLGVPEAEVGAEYPVRIQGQDAALGWEITAADAGRWELVIAGEPRVLTGSDAVRLGSGASEVLLRQVAAAPARPREFSLGQNYPNPFNAGTTIRYEVAEEGMVFLDVYDLGGQRVRSLVRDVRPPGTHVVLWDGTSDTGYGVASGVYLVRMWAGEWAGVRKVALVR